MQYENQSDPSLESLSALVVLGNEICDGLTSNMTHMPVEDSSLEIIKVMREKFLVYKAPNIFMTSHAVFNY